MPIASPSRARSRYPRTSLLMLALGLALSAGPAATAARAGTDSFCNQSVGSGSVCYGPSHSLTAVRGWNYTSGTGCGGAQGYGQYYCATPAGCHTYAGANVLSPGIRHRSSTAKTMGGYSTWGSTGAPSYCDPGSPYAVAGPIADEAAYAEGIPVLGRDVVSAPPEVAALVPGANPSAARRFQTPGGSAWVLVDAAGRRVCLVADDRGTGYGFSCQRLGDARAKGALSTFEDDDTTTAAGDVVIALGAEGVDELLIERRDGTRRTVAIDRGVAVVSLAAGDRAVELEVADDAPAGAKAQRLAMVRRG